MNNIMLRVKVNDAKDRQTLSGILADAGCAVWVEKEPREGARKGINDYYVQISTREGEAK